MENLFIELVKAINPVQTIILIIGMSIIYHKTKAQMNGLGARFDRQFGEYKGNNRNKINEIEQRIVKLETEQSFFSESRAIIERLDNVSRSLACK